MVEMNTLSNDDLFNFLTGREKDSFQKRNILIEHERLDGSTYIMHHGVKDSLIKLQKMFLLEQIQMEIASGYRSFEQQELIWNEKVEGKRTLLDADEVTKLDVNKLSEEIILEKILLFSSIPGVSRHHWGTDFDFFDLTYYKLNSKKLLLVNSEYTKEGPNSHLIEKFIKWEQNDTHSFYRPYVNQQIRQYQQNQNAITSDFTKNSFVLREEWHISDKNLSSKFQEKYTFEIFCKNLKNSHFHLKNIIMKRPEYFFQNIFLVS